MESRREAKESKRKEEELRRTERKRKFTTNMGWNREETNRARITSVDTSETYSLDNTLGVGDVLYPGVTMEGEGVVPGIDLMIHERSQATNRMMQILDDTRILENGLEQGSLTAGVDWIGK